MSRNQTLLAVVVALALAAGAAAWYVLRAPAPAPMPGFAASSTDHTLGDPKAPIVAIEYAAPQCPFCAQFNAKGMTHLKAEYIDTGKVFYIFRMFPIGPADIPAESIARCLPADKYFAFIDLLYRNQAKWDPENGVEDVHGALVAMARIAGLDAQKVDACIADKDVQKQIIAVAQDAQSRFGINGTPTFVLNGEVQSPGAPWEEIKAKLDSLLAKK
jgi:protein-disulfide isomerase